jgi:hypothetical protein
LPFLMLTLPDNATDDDFRAAVFKWFRLVATGALDDAQEFLDTQHSTGVMKVQDFVARVAELTSGGVVTMPEPITHDNLDELRGDGPIAIVCRWIPGAETTEKCPGFIADILHTIPVDGEWSDIDASFFVRAQNGAFVLQLRDVIRAND